MSAPYQKHSQTSINAAGQIEDAAPTLRDLVYEFIKSRGEEGATDEEVQIALSMNPSTERPRRIELRNSGYIGDSGDMRKTRSGCAAMVWVAIECL